MQGFIAIGALAVIVIAVIIRSRRMKSLGIEAFHFGKMDRKDFIIPPFALLYFYLIIANIWGLPKLGAVLARSPVAAWVGAALCVLALALFLWGLVSFGNSLRVGIDAGAPGALVTTGAFSVSRNPLYVGFFMIFIGVFLVFPAWVFFAYLIAGMWLVDRQVCREENALRGIYGKAYNDYCEKVRRYL